MYVMFVSKWLTLKSHEYSNTAATAFVFSD